MSKQSELTLAKKRLEKERRKTARMKAEADMAMFRFVFILILGVSALFAGIMIFLF